MVNSPAIKKEQRTELGTPDGPLGLLFTPRVDIVETEEELLLLADVPGVKPEDVDVRFDNGELIIDGRCAARHEGANCLLSEYGVGDFYRAFCDQRAHRLAEDFRRDKRRRPDGPPAEG